MTFLGPRYAGRLTVSWPARPASWRLA